MSTNLCQVGAFYAKDKFGNDKWFVGIGKDERSIQFGERLTYAEAKRLATKILKTCERIDKKLGRVTVPVAGIKA